MKNALRHVLLGLSLLGGGPALAQSTNPIVTSWMLNTTGITGFNNLEANVQSVKYSNTSVYVAAKGIPSYSSSYVADGTGGAGTTWFGQPTTGPVAVTYTTYRFRLPLTPTPNTGTLTAVPGANLGLWINGTNIHPAKDAASYNTSTGTVTNNGGGVWFTDAVVNEGVGFDNCNGHPDISSVYHTHVNPDCLYDRRDSTRHSPIIGFALDGYPIYGAYGYKIATDPTSGIKSLKSSYRLRNITVRTHLSSGALAAHAGPAVSTTFPLGKFVEDNEYVVGLGDLNANNGRWCKTPEYPNGTYAYFCTINTFYEGAYPYTLAGTYYGTVPYSNTNSTTATITGGEASALQTYTNPASLTVTTNKVLGGGTFTNVTVASGGNLVVTDPVTASGAISVQTGGAIDLGTLDANSATVGGTGSFGLASGAKIRLDNTAGITSSGATGAVQNTGTRTFDASAEYVYEHTAAQVTGNGLPASPKTVTFNNSSTTGVTLSQSLTVPTDGTLTLKDGQLITAAGKNLTVDGTLVAGTEQLLGGGAFTLNSGGTLKTANTSGINTTGTTGSVRTTTRTFNSGATYVYNGTAAQVTGTALPASATHVTIANSSSTGVTLSQTLTTPATGTLTITDGQLITASGKNLAINGTADLGTNTVTGGGTFTLNSGATLKTAHANGVASTGNTGSVQNTGTRTLDAGASYVYNGTVTQTMGANAPATIKSLTVDNAAGLTLGRNVTATATAAPFGVTMTTGLLTTGTAYKVTMGSQGTLTETDASYVLGNVEVARALTTAGTTYDFGNIGLKLTPTGLVLPGNTTALRVTGIAPTGVNDSPGIQRYFTITPTVNVGLDVTMALSYRTAELNGLNESLLGFYKSTVSATTGPWVNQTGTLTRDAANNTLTLAGVTGFSTWTLGGATPMPVELVSFVVARQDADAVLRWATASEQHNDRFEVEVSTDGRTFRRLGQVPGAGNSSQRRAYEFVDANLARHQVAVVYYRLRQVDGDGTSDYSPVRPFAVEKGSAGALALLALPNPASPADQLRLQLAAPASGPATLILRDALGRVQYQQELDLSAGTTQAALTTEATARLRPGVYSVQLLSGGRQVSTRLVWQ